MIKINGLKFSYPDSRVVFDGFSFNYTINQKIGLVGSNGSGKTTLFYLIMGLLKPQAGEIEIFGKVRKTEKDFEEVRRRIGFLFQDSDDQLFCPTVKEDIAFGPLNLGHSKKEAMEIVGETCELLGLEGYEDRVSYRLSEGEKRLVSLATVVAMKPEILLLDEPTTGLDEEVTGRVLSYFKKNTPSLIMVTQHIDHLKKLSVDEIYRLDKGKISSLVREEI